MLHITKFNGDALELYMSHMHLHAFIHIAFCPLVNTISLLDTIISVLLKLEMVDLQEIMDIM